MPHIKENEWTTGRIPGELRHKSGMLFHVTDQRVYHDRIIEGENLDQLMVHAEHLAKKYTWLSGTKPIWLR